VVIPQGGHRGCCWLKVAAPALYLLRQGPETPLPVQLAWRDKFWVHSNQTIPEGEVELRYEFEPTGKPTPPRVRGAGARPALHQPQAGRQRRHALLDPVIFGTQACPAVMIAPIRQRRRSIAMRSASPGLSSASRSICPASWIQDSEADMKIAMRRPVRLDGVITEKWVCRAGCAIQQPIFGIIPLQLRNPSMCNPAIQGGYTWHRKRLNSARPAMLQYFYPRLTVLSLRDGVMLLPFISDETMQLLSSVR